MREDEYDEYLAWKEGKAQQEEPQLVTAFSTKARIDRTPIKSRPEQAQYKMQTRKSKKQQLAHSDTDME